MRKRLLHSGSENYDHTDLDAGAVFFADAFWKHECPCCAIELHTFEHELPTTPLKPGHIQFRWLKLEICKQCGWWHFQQDAESSDFSTPSKPLRSTWWELTHAVQVEIDLGSHTLPVEQLQLHLMRHWEDRKLISAQQAEDLVASLLQDHHGGQVLRMTANANSADGGVDLYLSARDDGTIQRAVQVKRRISTDVESVKEVRNFVGAMVLEGASEGIFVTTASRFSRHAQAVPRLAQKAKFRLGLDLIDGEQLLEMLAATNAPRLAELPPRVEPNQEWRDISGRAILACDLFAGDMDRWES